MIRYNRGVLVRKWQKGKKGRRSSPWNKQRAQCVTNRDKWRKYLCKKTANTDQWNFVYTGKASGILADAINDSYNLQNGIL